MKGTALEWHAPGTRGFVSSVASKVWNLGGGAEKKLMTVQGVWGAPQVLPQVVRRRTPTVDTKPALQLLSDFQTSGRLGPANKMCSILPEPRGLGKKEHLEF